MSTIMRVFCAWCGKQIRVIDGKGQVGASHGICPECAKKEMEKIEDSHKPGKRVQQLLDAMGKAKFKGKLDEDSNKK